MKKKCLEIYVSRAKTENYWWSKTKGRGLLII